MSHRIVLVTSNPGLSKMAEEVAGVERLELTRFETAEAVLQADGTVADTCIVVDQGLTEMSAFDLVARLRERHPEARRVLVSHTPTFEGLVSGLRRGADDVLFAPVDPDQFVRAIWANEESWPTFESLPGDALSYCPTLVGGHPVMREVYRHILAFADRPAPVLITGETDTGKGVVARWVHAVSARRGEPFRVMNCAGIASGVLESEVFGHERGAFSGAEASRRGHLESAGRGTLLLDEIGDASAAFQSALVRVLEEGRYFRVGGDEERQFGGRVVAATNRDLHAQAAEGRFRQDLIFRLEVLNIHMPPLRERGSDLEHLIDHFLGSRARAEERPRKRVSGKALRKLRRHPWPGNARELAHCLERAEALSSGPLIEERDVRLGAQGDPHGADEARRDGSVGGRDLGWSSRPQRYVSPDDPAVEEARIREALELEGGHQGRAAERLGMHRITLWRRMRRYGIESP
ncbi:MAG: sigma-54 dependent transcriptional regulator [Gemmatimonadota bacterium]